MVRRAGFNRQNGRKHAFNHAGNMVGAGLSWFLCCRFGFTAVFWLPAAFGVLSIASVLMIPPAHAERSNLASARIVLLWQPVARGLPRARRRPMRLVNGG